MTRESLTKFFGTEFTDSKDNFKAKCPFHSERTPSFYVHKEEYIAHCFGCSISGTIDQLGVQFSSLPLVEVREALCISISERVQTRLDRNRGVEEKEQGPRRIPESWLAPFKKEVHKYVINRGFSSETIRGVNSLYDQVTKRQVFPHRNRRGELVGAVGRACVEQDPKWLFYFGYDKGQTLYAPYGLTSVRPITLVEGVFDVLWLAQHGYTNVCAPIGASATREQLSEVAQYGEDVILGFDNDEAGQNGNRRVYEALRSNCRCWFLDWPENTNDWMDLDEEGIANILSTRRTPLEHRLRGGVTRSGARCS